LRVLLEAESGAVPERREPICSLQRNVRQVNAMRRFVVFACAIAGIVALGVLLPHSQFSHRAFADPQLQTNWSTGACAGNDSNGWGHWGEAHVCELRESTLTLPSGDLSVQTINGSIDVAGEDRSDVALEATVNVWAPSESAANDLQKQIAIFTADGNIHAHGPHISFFTRGGYSISYRLHVPSKLAADFHTVNGGIHLSHLDGRLRFGAVNGAVTLDHLNGDVVGRTVNGGIHIVLAGDGWQGAGLSAKTVNGGIGVSLPENYSAHLEAATVNGGISVDFPITVQGTIKHHLDATIGSGGPAIHTQTVNGGINIKHGGGSAE